MNKTYPEPVVGAFIINSQNKLFLMKSHKWKDKYVVPGGHIEIGEKIEEALIREVKEETNLKITSPEFICLWEFVEEEEFHDKKHFIFLDYRVEAISDEIILNEEGQEYIWAGKDEIFQLPLEKYTKMTIEKFGSKIFS
ncbi:MAG TPA: NUDIX domain-containing protein [Patescibacteria group bacterium]